MAVREGIEDFLLRLPAPLRERAEEMACRECVSLNLFLVMAVAEKLQRLQLQGCFEISDKQELRHEGGMGSRPIIHELTSSRLVYLVAERVGWRPRVADTAGKTLVPVCKCFHTHMRTAPPVSCSFPEN